MTSRSRPPGSSRQLTEDNVGVFRLLSDEVDIVKAALDDLHLTEGFLDGFALGGVSHQYSHSVLWMRLFQHVKEIAADVPRSTGAAT